MAGGEEMIWVVSFVASSDVDFPCSFFTMSFEIQDTPGLLEFSFTQIPRLV